MCYFSGSTANSYTIQMVRFFELATQHVFDVKKSSDAYNHKLNSSAENLNNVVFQSCCADKGTFSKYGLHPQIQAPSPKSLLILR